MNTSNAPKHIIKLYNLFAWDVCGWAKIPRRPRKQILVTVSHAKTFELEDEDERFRCGVAVDDADFNLVVNADIDCPLTPVSSTAAAHRLTAFVRYLPDRRIHSAHSAAGRSRRRRGRISFSVVVVDSGQ